MAGANFNLAVLVRGDIGVRLTTAARTGSRSVEDATMAPAATHLSTYLGLRVDYGLVRKVIISGDASWGADGDRDVDAGRKNATARASPPTPSWPATSA